MESTHLLTGAKKRVKIHPHTVTAKYATSHVTSHATSATSHAPYSPQAGVHTHFPQPGDEGYDDAPSFEDFGSFLEETSDRKRLTDSRKWPLTLFKETAAAAKPQNAAGAGGGGGGDGSDVRAAKGSSGKGVGEQLASFGEASVTASRLTWVGLIGAAVAHGCVIMMTRLASERFGLGPLFLLLVRSVVQLVAVAFPLRRGENPLGPPGYRLRLLGYGVSYSLAVCCGYASLTFVSSETAAAWRLATTALSAILAFLLLEERLGLSDGIAVASGLCGLALALLPVADSPVTSPVAFWRGAFGWSLSAVAGLWMALALVNYRSLKERVSVATALFSVSWTGCVLAPAAMLLLAEGWRWPGGAAAWGVVVGVACCSAAGFVGVTHGLARIHPALVSASQGLEVAVAAALRLPWATPAAPEVVGDAMVALSVGWMVAVKLMPARGAARRQREEYEEILDSPIK